MLMSLPALAMGLGAICIIDTVFEKMTQYGEFGCIH